MSSPAKAGDPVFRNLHNSCTAVITGYSAFAEYDGFAERHCALARGRIPSMLPRPHIAEQKSRHFPLLDFLAAFGDAVAAVMPVDVFERLVARVTHAAMHLHGAVGGFAAQAVCPEIAHRHLVGE